MSYTFNSSSISPLQVRKNIYPTIFLSSIDSSEFYKLLWCQKENEGGCCLCGYHGVTIISQLPQPEGDIPGPTVSGQATEVPLPSPRWNKGQSCGITPASMKGMCSGIRPQHPRTSSQKFCLFLQTWQEENQPQCGPPILTQRSVLLLFIQALTALPTFPFNSI